MKDGGSAFPSAATDTWRPVRLTAPDFSGMSLRDYFAARALPHFLDMYEGEQAAQNAYVIADAMLIAREAPSVQDATENQ